MDAVSGQHSLTLPADRPSKMSGPIAISGGDKSVTHQRAGLAAGAYQRGRAASLIQQVPDLAKIVHPVAAQ
jgi:hypothetical protein